MYGSEIQYEASGGYQRERLEKRDFRLTFLKIKID
jgi:hypothetical protein